MIKTDETAFHALYDQGLLHQARVKFFHYHYSLLFSCPSKHNNIVTELHGAVDAFGPVVSASDIWFKVFYAFSKVVMLI